MTDKTENNKELGAVDIINKIDNNERASAIDAIHDMLFGKASQAMADYKHCKIESSRYGRCQHQIE